ncbi:MAG TPA: FG-GAP-like repeat-containing protein [Saprospiraceae bacterium]|nr:FG-GAP-like repeat-containing protein [Saprospiraceae bacterium]
MQRSIILIFFLFFYAVLSAQISFTNQTNLLTPIEHFSGVAIAVCDMNGDGLDDIVRLSQGTDLNIQYQTLPNQPFTASITYPLPGDDTWGMCTADFNNDGLGDVLSGGRQNGIKFTKSKPDGTFSAQIVTSPVTFVQCVNFADINNDGWLDAFVCHDDGVSRIFKNNGGGVFGLQSNMINLNSVPASDNSGNYGSVWSDINNDGYIDLYIAKCRQDVNDPTDPRRINQLFLNNGDFTFTQDITNQYGLRIGAQSWTADFGDIDNDGDFDCFITNHDVPSQLLENDGAGHFTDITATSGGFVNDIIGLPLQGVFKDFDNDGYVDILVAGYTHHLFRNNGNKTFTQIANPFNFNKMESFAIGDLNSDGFLDVYGGYAEVYTNPSNIPDVLWMNNGNNNHFYGLRLRGVESNLSAVGAKVHLYSALGIQTREVRSGESYGISNSLHILFGLGPVTQVDSVVVNWPSGVRDVIYQPAIDQYSTFYEGGCFIESVTIQSSGPTVICPGDTVVLSTAVPFVQYQWSNGETSASIQVSANESYHVTVTDDIGCTAVSVPVAIIVDPVSIPTITPLGDTTFCEGGKVTLQASASTDYLWSTGATTQSIEVAQSGTYTVSAKGLCSFFPSVPMQVTVLQANPPQVEPDTVMPGEAALLTAIGEQVAWYDTPDNQTPLEEGSTFNTPPLVQNTTYWVENTSSFGVPNEFTGMTYHQGSINSDINYNGGLIFDCIKPVTLLKTKVYTTKEGERLIELRDVAGNVLQSATVFIPKDTSVIELNFDIPIGEDMLLTTNPQVNQANLASAGPQLRRSSNNCEYPYEIPGVLSIKNSTFNEDRYYYFYDWEVGFDGLSCTSERVPVTVVVEEDNSSTTLPSWTEKLNIYPNPTDGQLIISLEGYSGGELLATTRNAQGQLLQQQLLQAAAGHAVFKTDLNTLPQGMYWLELTHAQGKVQRKVVKQ